MARLSSRGIASRTARWSLMSMLVCNAAAYVGTVNLFERQSSQVISSSGSCGSIDGVETSCIGSVEGNCCSYLGFCGSNSSYCGAGCQGTYGVCGDSKISTDGSCGAGPGWTCLGASMGNCCSSKGYCGETSAHCGEGCQSEWGDCYDSASGTTTTAISTPTPVSTDSSIPSDASAAAATASGSGSPSVVPTEKESSSLSAGAKGGIAVGAIVGIGALFAFGFLLFRRRRQQKANDKSSEAGFITVDRKEMPDGRTPEPTVYHELHDERRPELHGSDSQGHVPLGGAYNDKTPAAPLSYELSADRARSPL